VQNAKGTQAKYGAAAGSNIMVNMTPWLAALALAAQGRLLRDKLRLHRVRRRSGQQNQGYEGGQHREDCETDAHGHSVAHQGAKGFLTLFVGCAAYKEGFGGFLFLAV
jgi:hypothetical protein